MMKLHRALSRYLVCALPFVIALITWDSVHKPSNEQFSSPLVQFIYEALSLNIPVWFASLFIFLILILTSSAVRELTLEQLANIKERDEREEHVTGRAARSVYLATIGLLVFMLFTSVFSLEYYRLAEENRQATGKNTALSISMKLDLFNKNENKNTTDKQNIFSTRDWALSSTGTILLVLGWQLAGFNLVARRANARDLQG